MSGVTNKDYWEKLYKNELVNFLEDDINPEDWFEEECNTILNWIASNVNYNKDPIKIIDIGCGNCSFIAKLIEIGFKNIYGIDYVIEAIETGFHYLQTTLEKNLISVNVIEENQISINLSVMDIVNPQSSLQNSKRFDNNIITNYYTINILSNSILLKDHGPFDIIHDKGTFDIFFMSNTTDLYIRSLYINFVKGTSLFFLTSCNATKEELIHIFTHFHLNNTDFNDITFEVISEANHKSFSFGDQTGQTLTSLLFKFKTNK